MSINPMITSLSTTTIPMTSQITTTSTIISSITSLKTSMTTPQESIPTTVYTTPKVDSKQTTSFPTSTMTTTEESTQTTVSKTPKVDCKRTTSSPTLSTTFKTTSKPNDNFWLTIGILCGIGGLIMLISRGSGLLLRTRTYGRERPIKW